MKKTDSPHTQEGSLLDKAIRYASHWHAHTRHTYDGRPYRFHLKMVADTARRFVKEYAPEVQELILAACWCHDLIEDARQNYNDVKREVGKDVAEIAYALTNEKGRTRKERANARYYQGIRQTPYATLVKLCDRIANVAYSAENGSRMVEVYRAEHASFRSQLYVQGEYEAAWDELDRLLMPDSPRLT